MTGTKPGASLEAASGSARRAVLALARVEARKLARHPAVLAGFIVTAFFLTMGTVASDPVFGSTRETPNLTYMLVATGWAFLPVCAGTFIAANQMALRSRRDRTDELFEPAVLSGRHRLDAQFLALAGPALIVVAAAALLLAAIAIAGGVPVAFRSGIVDRVPSPFEMMQPVAAVVVCGALGIVVGRFLPLRAVAPLLLPGFLANLVGISWSLEGIGWRLLPLASHGRSVGWTEIPGGGPDTPSGYEIFSSFDMRLLAAHLLYLAALAALAWSVARFRRERDRRTVIAGGIALVLTVAAAIGHTI